MRRAIASASALLLAFTAVACGGQASPLFDDAGSGGSPAAGSSVGGTSASGATGYSTASSGTSASSGSGDPTSSSASGGEGGDGPGSGGSGPGSGGDGPGSGGNGSGGDGSGGAALCGDVLIGDPVPAVVVLALDASGSMAGGDGLPEKWGPTTSAIASLVDVAPPDLQFGLVPFPAGDFDYNSVCVDFGDPACVAAFADGGCEDVRAAPAVAVAPLEESGPAIVDWMEARTPDGGTPTYWALRRAYDVAADVPGDGDRFVVLFTDGVPNVYGPEQNIGGFIFPESNIECRDLEDIVEEAADAADASRPIRTFVVGAPGSEEGAAFLSSLAVAGGTAPPGCNVNAGQCHVQIGAADYEDDLAAALAEIAGKAAGCRFEVPLDDPDADLIEVVLETGDDDIDVARDTDHEEGWDLVDEDPTTIELYGTACELYREEASNVVRVQLLCEE